MPSHDRADWACRRQLRCVAIVPGRPITTDRTGVRKSAVGGMPIFEWKRSSLVGEKAYGSIVLVVRNPGISGASHSLAADGANEMDHTDVVLVFEF